MHEVALCQSAFDIIEQHAKQNHARRVTGVWLELSAVSCVEESAVHFCFDIICRNTLAEGAKLHINTIPATAWCRDCQSTTQVIQFATGCPHCGSQNLQIDSSDTMQVKQIEVE
ncbi:MULTISPECIES: hydrogenase maturation nickel metallochaperone HypA [Providencia]|uniref:Hydrogenase maturation factor HypA n=1 Tax=Providencia heimbachae ATCC 35613 TaxID=1354272 RepID=A0A1B7JLE7_9GAMM|nr:MULTISPECIES: hydrogenase maturation nickel metallochaperone HypA [Providencia]MBP6124106.1 hydrogenase maturation nickel metallochaperone HypA [Providencia sp.]NIH21896.1 hydrogenase maturation nickel metallochaperone HypA [Providencia heimbachae]OAT48726.1 HybF family [NiFe] hydrogenase nickel incorporation protein [Providencia heimbachae ATCC 35613]QCJ69394.1 hydrogenase maturation nickel metallochaperone HypA [Providencia heimbachae]SQH12448.1 hydrogenase nickel incorporation protein Hy